MGKSKKGKLSGNRSAPARKDTCIDDLEAIVERSRRALSDEEHETLKEAIGTLSFLTSAIESKNASIDRLRNMFFGPKTEDSKTVLGRTGADTAEANGATAIAEDVMEEALKPVATSKPSKARRRKGHGRAGADAYTGATLVEVAHSELKSGDRCPECTSGSLYTIKTPGVLVRITGMAPLSATVIKLEKLRCGLCGETFTAREPPGTGTEKYDHGATAMVGLLKYSAGLPFNRIETLQAGFGIPMPSSTQKLSADARLERHQAESGPLMNELE